MKFFIIFISYLDLFHILRREVFAMEKKDINWGELGFSYQQTEKRFVANFKDVAWDEGDLPEDATITLTECSGVFQSEPPWYEGIQAYITESAITVCIRPN